ncbi:MIP family channel protein [Caldalkalibacillus salinus]|uniref:MIP family channel protein n=1 Tax=Caldalkalibacillus salinus TaxID=2803787 RepID=UPI001922C40D
MTAFVGEIVGTMLLIIFGGGVVAGVSLAHSKAQNAGWMVVAVGWGLAVTLAVYAVGDVSGAHINPAVTIGLATIGDFPWSQVPSYIIAQIIGAFIGSVIVWLQYLPHWQKTKNQEAILAVFSTGPAIKHKPSNVLSEMIGTFILVFGLLTIGTNDFTQGLNPLVVGLLIVAIGVSLGGTTGYAINPARDLGPRLAHWLLPIRGKGVSNWGYAWVPVVGPILGGVLGALVYRALYIGEGMLITITTLSVTIAFFLMYYGVAKGKAGHQVEENSNMAS